MRASESLLSKLYHIYFREICWPYTTSFWLTLLIYLADLKWKRHPGWASVVASAILSAYYLMNLYFFRKGVLNSAYPPLFILFLTVKLSLWIGILILITLFVS
jgi:hypothetical protein